MTALKFSLYLRKVGTFQCISLGPDVLNGAEGGNSRRYDQTASKVSMAN